METGLKESRLNGFGAGWVAGTARGKNDEDSMCSGGGGGGGGGGGFRFDVDVFERTVPAKHDAKFMQRQQQQQQHHEPWTTHLHLKPQQLPRFSWCKDVNTL